VLRLRWRLPGLNGVGLSEALSHWNRVEKSAFIWLAAMGLLVGIILAARHTGASAAKYTLLKD